METIKGGDFELYKVYKGTMLESYSIINPLTNYLAQFDVLNDGIYNWERLFLATRQVSGTIKINNVDTSLKNKTTFLNRMG